MPGELRSAPFGATTSTPPRFGAQIEPESEALSWGDRVGPKKLRHRHEVLAWLCASGATQRRIAFDLGMSESRVSILLSNTKVQQRVKEIREQYWKEKYDARFNMLAPAALDFAGELIRGETGAKVSERWDASKWLLEKVTGKPKQELEVEAGGNIRSLLAMLDQMKSGGASGQQAHPIVDVTAHKPKQDELSAWVAEHVPVLGSEKEDK